MVKKKSLIAFNLIRQFFFRFASLIDQGLVSGGNFLVIALGAQYLSKVEQGKLGIVFSIYIAAIVLNNGILFQWAGVQAPKETEKRKYKISLAYFQALIGGIFSLLIVIAFYFWGEAIGWKTSGNEAILFGIFLVIQQAADFLRRAAYIFTDPMQAVYNSALIYPIRVLLIIVIRPSNVSTFLLILILSSVLPIIFAGLIKWDKKFIGSLTLQEIKSFIVSHWSGTKALVLGGPLGWLEAFLPVFFLGNITGIEAVAVLTSVRSIANLTNVFMEILDTSVAAKVGILYTQSIEKFNSYLRKLLFWGGAAWFISFLVIVFLGPKILLFILGANYAQYNGLLLLLWVSQGLNFLFRVDGIRIRTHGKTTALLGAVFAATCVVAAAGYPIIQYCGIYGAVYLFIIGAVIIELVQFYMARKTS